MCGTMSNQNCGGHQQHCCHSPLGMMSKKSRLEMLQQHREALTKQTQEVDELIKELEIE